MNDILFTRCAAASFLGLKPNSLRMAIWRKRIKEESCGLISESELEHYRVKYRRKKPGECAPPPAKDICRRCGQLVDNARLCEWCQEELETGHYMWYTI